MLKLHKHLEVQDGLEEVGEDRLLSGQNAFSILALKENFSFILGPPAVLHFT